MTPQNKTKLWIAGGVTLTVIVLLVLILIFWDKIKDTIKTSSVDKELKEEIKTAGDGQMSQANIRQTADILYQAMEGWGTDEQAIYDAFTRIHTYADLVKVISAFGIRDDKTLPQYIVSELSTSERRKLNNIIASNGIDYAF